jgi:uncharacterized protein YgiM (DUF1202 family)
LKRNTWLVQCFVLLGTLGLAVTDGCHSKRTDIEAQQGRRLTVIVGEEGLYQQPDRLSRKVTTLSFGQEVTVLERKRPATAHGWEEIHAGQKLSGFVRSSTLGPPELIEKLRGLMKSIEGVEPQAVGVTTAATNFRLEPGSEGQVIEKLPAGTRFEMFERQATLTPQVVNPVAGGPKETKARKEVWYKVRLPDGRVGYIYTRNLEFEPPTELTEYTRSRRTVAWLKLRSLKSETSDSVNEYLVAYATPGVDFGADYNRVEIYIWDGKGYQTAFAQSSLQGILPIHVIHEGNDVFFELRELDNKQPGHVLVRRYHFPHPIKEVGRSNVEAAVGLH